MIEEPRRAPTAPAATGMQQNRVAGGIGIILRRDHVAAMLERYLAAAHRRRCV